MTQQSTFPKTPAEVLDFSWDWTSWLTAGDVITAAVWRVAPEDGLTVRRTRIQETVTTAFLSGGVIDKTYLVTCAVDTQEGLLAERSFRVNVVRSRFE